MSSEHIIDEQKAANLARIRDNQRRSRARRKEYLQELEERYRACEQLGVEASAEMQSAARRVIDENRYLRSMLRQHGYTDADIDHAIMEGTSAMPAVAGLEALVGKRRRPTSNQEFGSSSTAQIQRSSGSDSLATVATSTMWQSQPQAPDQSHINHLSPNPQTNIGSMMPDSAITAPGNMYAGQSQWPTYDSQSAYPNISGLNTSSMSHRFENMPSIQSIKSEIGYGPQEEIDCQSTDAEYSLTDGHGYDTTERYPR